MSSHDEKAKRYIHSLNQARCSGSWNELPELIRKVTKHAPDRKCLIQTANSENDVARTVSLRSAGPSSISERIPQLLSLVETEKSSTEEHFQAQACLGWIHWILGEHEKVVERLPQDLAATVKTFANEGQSGSPWTEVCLVKAAYIRGASLVRIGKPVEALSAFESIAPWMLYSREKALADPQLAYWSEQLLAQKALLYSKTIDFQDSDSALESKGLQAFREWAKFATRNKELPAETYGNTSAHLRRLTMWKADYRFLSGILSHGLAYPEVDGEVPQKSDQAAELRRVETMYENELLRVTPFPNATDSNVVVEEWVEEVVNNWQLLCGRCSSDGLLGESGRNSASRKVLDILYRGASKTFHSTLILRRLFQVHKSLAEFDLAYSALDTYIELIEKGRARAAKSNKEATGQDNDETVLMTLSEGIENLCAFGRQDAVERAYRLSEKLEDWVERLSPESNKDPTVNGHTEGNVEGLSDQKTTVSPEVLEIVYRAVGTARAQWARWTPFNEKRTVLQTEAVSNFKKSMTQVDTTENQVPQMYALGLLLAEMRDINQAIDTVKQALVSKRSNSGQSLNFIVERNMIPLWHLLALLLTARQDFDTAGQTCAAAFEQFSSSTVLFGTEKQTALSSETSAEKVPLMTDSERGLVDDMECAELQRIIEIRITELALTELVNGPEDAVNRSNELLGLYARLFGRFGVASEEKSPLRNLEPPKSSATTVRSFRGSIFGRKKLELPGDTGEKSVSTPKPASTRPSTRATEAPTIQVTDEHGKSPTQKHHHFRKSEDRSIRESKHSTKGRKRPGSISKFIRSHSKERKPDPEKSVESSQAQSFDTVRENPITNGTETRDLMPPETEKTHLAPQHTTDEVPAPSTSLTSQSSPQATKSQKPTASTAEASQPKSTQSAGLTDRLLPRVSPSVARLNIPPPRFSRLASQKHALTVLIKIWLVIATLYRRAQLFEDAREACDEAAKVAQRIETLTGTVESSARNFADAGWGGSGKSSDEIWADVYCERAQLALNIAHAGDEKAPTQVVDSERVREAVESFEQCLMYFPDHARGIVGLSNVLLDFYEKKVELGRRVDDGKPKEEAKERTKPSAIKVSNNTPNGTPGNMAISEHRPSSATNPTPSGPNPGQTSGSQADEELKKTPENLNRLAARDRAYGLLSTVTKLGSGWDDSEAWYALARAHELGGEMEKARDILWWCVELEDRRPVRHWSNISCTGYVL